jgi:hypothetical protein
MTGSWFFQRLAGLGWDAPLGLENGQIQKRKGRKSSYEFRHGVAVRYCIQSR